MITQYRVAGYRAFIALAERLASNGDPNKNINAFFYGKKDADGISWCTDTELYEPFVLAFLQHVKRSMYFVLVDVGSRISWENMWNPFRTDKRLLLWQIPALLRWGQQSRQLMDGRHLRMSDWLDDFFNYESI